MKRVPDSINTGSDMTRGDDKKLMSPRVFGVSAAASAAALSVIGASGDARATSFEDAMANLRPLPASINDPNSYNSSPNVSPPTVDGADFFLTWTSHAIATTVDEIRGVNMQVQPTGELESVGEVEIIRSDDPSRIWWGQFCTPELGNEFVETGGGYR
ncbi:MAG: hypothetical protein AAB592_05780 [Patescibacteria group bacterium]